MRVERINFCLARVYRTVSDADTGTLERTFRGPFAYLRAWIYTLTHP